MTLIVSCFVATMIQWSYDSFVKHLEISLVPRLDTIHCDFIGKIRSQFEDEYKNHDIFIVNAYLQLVKN